MLAVIDNQLVTLEPVLDPNQSMTLDHTKISDKGEGRVMLLANGIEVGAGVTFYVMDGSQNCRLDQKTGKFTLGTGKQARIRAIFGENALEITIRRSLFGGPIKPMVA